MKKIFHNLHGASYVCQIDISDAYYQIELDDKKIGTMLGIPNLDGKIRHLEAYDGHQLTLLVSLTRDVE